MTITATKSWKNYMTLCRMLEKNEIPFICRDEDMTVRCSVSGIKGDQIFVFRIDPCKMMITLYSPLYIQVSDSRLSDIALGIAMINHRLESGAFCLDADERRLYFRMTTSFIELKVTDALFEYMLSCAADLTEEYSPRLMRLANEN